MKLTMWKKLGLSLILGPIMLFYWGLEYLKDLLVETGAAKGIYNIEIIKIGLLLSFTSIVLWIVLLTRVIQS